MAETDGSNVEMTVDEPKDESKHEPEDEPKVESNDESKHKSSDESEDGSNLESKIEQLLAVNRELGIFLEEQLDTTLSLRQLVAAIQGFLEADPTLKKKYEKYLQSVRNDGAGMPDVHWTNRIRGVLSRLQRTGTV